MTPDQLTQFSVATRRVCARFQIGMDDLESHKRDAGCDKYANGNPKKNLVLARQLLMVYGRSIGLTLDQIGALLNRCKSDAGYGCQAFKNRFDTEKQIRELWEWLTT